MKNDRIAATETQISASEIKNIISRISRIPVEELDDDALIREDLGVDSIMAMEIIATFEVKFGFSLEVDEYACINEVGEFVEIVQRASSA